MIFLKIRCKCHVNKLTKHIFITNYTKAGTLAESKSMRDTIPEKIMILKEGNASSYDCIALACMLERGQRPIYLKPATGVYIFHSVPDFDLL